MRKMRGAFWLSLIVLSLTATCYGQTGTPPSCTPNYAEQLVHIVFLQDLSYNVETTEEGFGKIWVSSMLSRIWVRNYLPVLAQGYRNFGRAWDTIKTYYSGGQTWKNITGAEIINRIKKVYPRTKFGFATFADSGPGFKTSPDGASWACYHRVMNLTTDTDNLLKTMELTGVKRGGQMKSHSFKALVGAAQDRGMGWRDRINGVKVTKVIVLITDDEGILAEDTADGECPYELLGSPTGSFCDSKSPTPTMDLVDYVIRKQDFHVLTVVPTNALGDTFKLRMVNLGQRLKVGTFDFSKPSFDAFLDGIKQFICRT